MPLHALRWLRERLMLAALVLPAVVAYGACGCRPGPTTQGQPAALDLARVRQELTDNRPAALNRYVGRTAEVAVTRLTILGGDERAIYVSLGTAEGDTTGGTIQLGYRATFRFADERNGPLWSAKTGPCRGVIRGVVSRFNANPYGLADSQFEAIELDPAWVEGSLTFH